MNPNREPYIKNINRRNVNTSSNKLLNDMNILTLVATLFPKLVLIYDGHFSFGCLEFESV